MRIEDVIRHLSAQEGLLILRPGPDDNSPEVAWGDVFFYYSADGSVPPGQPFATIVTKDYPDEPSWCVEPGAYRVNIGVGAEAFRDLLGHEPGEASRKPVAANTQDTLMPHPSYGRLGWICVVNPGERTADVVLQQLDLACSAARRRHRRRHGEAPQVD